MSSSHLLLSVCVYIYLLIHIFVITYTHKPPLLFSEECKTMLDHTVFCGIKLC